MLDLLEIKKWEKINFTLATRIQELHISEYKGEISTSDIPKIMLNRLNLLDYESRTLSSSFQNLFSPREEIDKESYSASVHPMDIFLLIFFSCDKMYRQKFVIKIAKCQLSLPLIAHDPYSQRLTIYSFAFQKLFKECSLSEGKKCEFPIASQVLNTISAVRIGNEGMERSKSKILNDLLGVSHDYFFHRSCEGSVPTNYLLNKTIEIGWYLPSGKKDSFEEPLTFLNLKGDATSLQKQLTFMLSVSNVLLVFISPQHFTEENIQVLENMFEHVNSWNNAEDISHVILIVESLGKRYDLRKLKNYKPNPSNLINLCKNEAVDRTKIISGIKAGLDSCTKKCCIDDFIGHAQKMEIFSEELDDDEVQKCSAEVHNILSRELPQDESQIDLSEVKKNMLPLQGDSWKRIAENHRKTENVQHDAQKKIAEQEIIRKEQLNYLKANPSFSMQRILTNVKESNDTNSDIFWRIFQNELDKLTKRHIPDLFLQYKQVGNELFEVSRQHPTQKQDRLIEKLEKISLNISKSSFGIEHIFRELSQIYEVCMNFRERDFNDIMNSLQIDPNDLIMLASKLLLSGFQLEILDGDVSHIPTIWVSEIFTQVSSLIGPSKRFYVVSVLGLQSSGKSTLLNTMFGLDFAVSAGKCTKGAFMNLIHVEAEAVKRLGFDYILIIDTEGLRAPELTAQESYLHDNEIATFAIGLADLTIINILGEHSTEMQDILEITIYALIRMRKALFFQPKCVFVHQNASAINIENQLVITRKFVQLLDEITATAAKKEKVFDLFQNFNSVIEFNPQQDIFYFPTLFRGDPPMAPINPGYCEAADKLRRFLLIESIQFSHSCLTPKEIATKVEDLWSSVLKEDFVFNYRNVQELSILYELDSAQSQWTAEFTQKLSEWVNKKAKIIESKKGNELRSIWKDVNSELKELTNTICLEEQVKIQTYFFRNYHKKKLLGSRESISDNFFKTMREKEFNYSFSSLREIYNKNLREIKDVFSDAEKDLYKKIVEELKNRKKGFAFLDRNEIFQIFDEKWGELISSIPNRREIQVIDIRVELRKLLIESPLLQDVKLSDKKIMLDDFSNYIDYCNNNPFPIADKYIDTGHGSPMKKTNIDPDIRSTDLTVYNKEQIIRIKLGVIIGHVRHACDVHRSD